MSLLDTGMCNCICNASNPPVFSCNANAGRSAPSGVSRLASSPREGGIQRAAKGNGGAAPPPPPPPPPIKPPAADSKKPAPPAPPPPPPAKPGGIH